MAKRAGLGVTEIDLSALAATVDVAVPLTPLRVAVMALEPAATAVAIPDELTEATAAFAAAQVAVVLTFPVEPSLYVAVAVNCMAAPGDMLEEAGVTEIDFRVETAFATVSVAVPLMPLRVAVTAVEPAATAVAIPEELIVATAVFAEAQFAVVLIFAVEPSVYVAVAVNCLVAPTAKLAVLGDAEIDASVFGNFMVTELPHPTLARISGRDNKSDNH